VPNGNVSHPWKSELTVSRELARSLILGQFPRIAPVVVEPMGFGWDNTAYLVDGHFVFRFPRRQLGADCLESEIRVLPSLVPLLPLPIPNPTFIGLPTDQFPWLFAGYERLAGRTACSTVLDESQRRSAARPLAEFLAVLHALGPRVSRDLGAPPDLLGRLDPTRRIPLAHEILEEVAGLHLISDVPRYIQVIDESATARAPQATALVHGDLYVRHILVDSDSRPSGIIDWGDVHLGDVALDLSIAHSFLPASAHQEFRQAYGPIDDATWRLARFRALLYGLQLAKYGDLVADSDLRREGLWILQNIIEQ
jgi:aminoglycoside phosphotransferase (APT) family kinase protein